MHLCSHRHRMKSELCLVVFYLIQINMCQNVDSTGVRFHQSVDTYLHPYLSDSEVLPARLRTFILLANTCKNHSHTGGWRKWPAYFSNHFFSGHLSQYSSAVKSQSYRSRTTPEKLVFLYSTEDPSQGVQPRGNAVWHALAFSFPFPSGCIRVKMNCITCLGNQLCC